MIETGLGTAAYLHFAASTPQVTLGCELFGPLLLADTITTKEPNYQDGSIFLSETEPGFGVEIDPAQLKRYTVVNPIIV
jgi:L-alanine-DL-glutamate epimerase-like enolase superfamily enzyme